MKTLLAVAAALVGSISQADTYCTAVGPAVAIDWSDAVPFSESEIFDDPEMVHTFYGCSVEDSTRRGEIAAREMIRRHNERYTVYVYPTPEGYHMPYGAIVVRSEIAPANIARIRRFIGS